MYKYRPINNIQFVEKIVNGSMVYFKTQSPISNR